MRSPICAALVAATVLLTAAPPASAQLAVTERFTSEFDVTDHYFEVVDPGHWRALVDAHTGAIFLFEDLTDGGVAAAVPPPPYGYGDHVNYVGAAESGTDCGYRFRAPLLSLEGVNGTTGRAFTAWRQVPGLADRLSFDWDGASFTATYTESPDSEAFLFDPSTVSVGGLPAGDPGDLLTTATLTLNAATVEGTVFRLSVQTEVALPAGEFVDAGAAAGARVWSSVVCEPEETYPGYAYGIDQAFDEDETPTDGPWNGSASDSFIRRTILDTPNNALLGLAAGRTFVLDVVAGYAGNPPTWDSLDHEVWTCGHLLRHDLPWGMALEGGTVKAHVIDLRIDIVREPADDPLEVSATVAPGEQWVYQNTPVGTADRNLSRVTVAINSGADAEETYQVTVTENGGPVRSFQIEQPIAMDGTAVEIPVRGGRRGPEGAGGSLGPAQLDFTVTAYRDGLPTGRTASATVTISLRPLGDVDGDGSVGGSDKQIMNNGLNGVTDGFVTRQFDLNGDGSGPGGADKQILNTVLNGAVPE